MDTLFVLLTTINTAGKQLAFNLRSGRLDRIVDVINGTYIRNAQKNLGFKTSPEWFNLFELYRYIQIRAASRSHNAI